MCHGSFGTCRISLVLPIDATAAITQLCVDRVAFAFVSLVSSAWRGCQMLFLLVFLPFSFSVVHSDLNLVLA